MERFFYLVIFLGGGAGAVARYILSALVNNRTGSFPWGTLSVNLAGAFAIGLLTELAALKFSMSETLRLLLVTGFLGGFTTFSAFTLESVLLFQKHQYMFLSAYVIASVLGGFLLFLLAAHLVRLL